MPLRPINENDHPTFVVGARKLSEPRFKPESTFPWLEYANDAIIACYEAGDPAPHIFVLHPAMRQEIFDLPFPLQFDVLNRNEKTNTHFLFGVELRFERSVPDGILLPIGFRDWNRFGSVERWVKERMPSWAMLAEIGDQNMTALGRHRLYLLTLEFDSKFNLALLDTNFCCLYEEQKAQTGRAALWAAGRIRSALHQMFGD